MSNSIKYAVTKFTSRKFSFFVNVNRVFANHWFQHFIAKFRQYFQGKDLILCFELNILDNC